MQRVRHLAHVPLVVADRGDQAGLAACGPEQLPGQPGGVAQGQVGAHPDGREHGVRGVADQGDPRRFPVLRRDDEAERDHEDRVQLHPADDLRGGGVPAGDGPPHRVAQQAGCLGGPRGGRRHLGARRDAARHHQVRPDRVERDVRCDVPRRLVHRPPRVEDADEHPAAGPVDGDDDAVHQARRHDLAQLRRQRHAAVHADAPHAGRDDRTAGSRCARTAERMPSAPTSTSPRAVRPSASVTVTPPGSSA